MANPNDKGHNQTEILLARLEMQLRAMYDRAAKDMRVKLDDYFRRFKKKDDAWQAAVRNGKKTRQEYIDWRYQQMLVGKKYREQVALLAEEAVKSDQKAMSIVRGYMPEAYAINHNYGTYQIENTGGIDTSYTLYDAQTVERLWREDPKLLPEPSPTGETAKKLAENKDLIWNTQKINYQITQGVIQGEPISKISKRLESVTDMDHNAAVRNARTMMTAAQNSGRYDSYHRADDMGIDLTLEWMSTLGNRTRTSHRLLNGQRRNVDEPFIVDDEIHGTVRIKYPGDLGGADYKVPQWMLYNCRCTIVAWVKGFEPNDFVKSSPKMGNISYEEWLKEKPKYNRITLPEEKAKAIKGSYINEYKRMRE